MYSIWSASAGSAEDVDLSSARVEPAQPARLPGEPQHSVPVKGGGIQIGAPGIVGQREALDAKGWPGLHANDRVQSSVRDPCGTVASNDDPVRQPAPKSTVLVFPVAGSASRRAPVYCGVYQMPPSAAGATSWGWEAPGRGYSFNSTFCAEAVAAKRAATTSGNTAGTRRFMEQNILPAPCNDVEREGCQAR